MDVLKCWCGEPAQYMNPASDATDATPVCIAHVADGYDLIRPMGAKVPAPVDHLRNVQPWEHGANGMRFSWR